MKGKGIKGIGLVNNLQIPSFAEEKMLVAEGYQLIAGVDEAGRGPLAGPVVAAAIILPYPLEAPWLDRVKDCKQLTSVSREFLFHNLHEVAISIGIGMAPPKVIDAQGIIRATRLAMKLAIEQLSPSPQSLLIDYLLLPEVSLPQKGIVNGDSVCFSIACASIIAKVTRDRIMIELDKTYPGYGLAQNKGYGTKEHFASLSKLGPSPIHRRSFKPVKDMID